MALPPSKPSLETLTALAHADGVNLPAYLQTLMRQQRSVTAAAKVVGVHAVQIGRTLRSLGWKCEGSTSNAVWIAPDGERFTVAESERYTRKDYRRGAKPGVPHQSPRRIPIDDGEDVLIIDLNENVLRTARLVLVKTEPIPGTMREIGEIARKRGFKVMYIKENV